MVADALDDGPGAAVADAESLGGTSPEQCPAAGCPVENDVADEHIVFGHECALDRWVDDETSARQALADVVIRIALQLQRDTASQKRAEALTCRAVEFDVDGVVGHSVLTPAPDQVVTQNGANGSVRVDDGQIDTNRAPMVDRIAG